MENDPIIDWTPEYVQELLWKALSMSPIAADSEGIIKGIINASTKPGYDPLNRLGGFFPKPKQS